MKWTDLDLGSGTWTVAAEEAKGGEEMKLVLTEQALDVLKRRRVQARELIQMVAARTLTPVPRMTLRESRRWRDNASKAATAEVFVFPGKGKTGHLVEPKAAWGRILDRAGLTDLRIHDLRRTMGAWLAAGGANAFAIQKALGHRSLAATAVYAQLDLTSVRAAMESVGNAMAKVVAAAREDRTTSDAGMAGPTSFPRTGKKGQ
jgi:integrase